MWPPVATFVLMKEVGIRELKNRLSEYVRLVRSGEVVMVTDRGEVVAELRRLGVDVLETLFDEVAPRIAEAYLQIKQRDRL